MYRFCILLILSATLSVVSCDKNNSDEDKLASIEQQINSARPLSQVVLKYRTSGSSVETFTGFSDAYAEDGMLVMKDVFTETYAVNLSLADLITVDGHNIEIIYQRP
ncbi:hypothetical protein JNL27_14450 [bacterium]|nr:hypothetical protein [bacterium]